MVVVVEEIGTGSIGGSGVSGFNLGEFLLQSTPGAINPGVSATANIVTTGNTPRLSNEFGGSSQVISPAETPLLSDDFSAYSPRVSLSGVADISNEFEGSSGNITPTEIPILSDDVTVKAGSRFASGYVAPKSEVKEMSEISIPSTGSPSMEALKKITDIYSQDSCFDVEGVMAATGYDRETVVYCIEWLVSQNLIAKEATRYCGLSSVRRMCEQLKGCKECFSNSI